MRVPKDRACQGGVESESGKSLRGPPASTMSGYISRAAPRPRDMPSFKVSLILIGNKQSEPEIQLRARAPPASHLATWPLCESPEALEVSGRMRPFSAGRDGMTRAAG